MLILLMLACVLLMTWLVGNIYIRRWSRGVSVGLRFGAPHYCEGDVGHIAETVTNNKLLPLWWGSIEYHLPAFITLEGGGYHGNADFRDSFSVFSFEQVERHVPFKADARGYYRISSAEILTHDIFFSCRLIRRYDTDAGLYVYPDPRRVRSFEPDFKRITGEIIKRRHYIEDEYQFRGIRDYTLRDSIRRVNWSATARTGQMKVNEYNCTSSQEAVLLLDFDAHGSWDRLAVKEDLIRSAASLAAAFCRAGIPLGIITNASDTAGGNGLYLPCRAGVRQLDECMRLLARIDYSSLVCPFTDKLDDIIAGSSQAQYVLMSYADSDALRGKLGALRASGRGAQWVFFADKGDRSERPPFPGITVCEVI